MLGQVRAKPIETWRSDYNPDLDPEWDVDELEDYVDEDDVEAMQQQMQEHLVRARPSHFTEYAIKVVDQKKNQIVPFQFMPERRYLRRPYDTGYNRVLLKMARQTEKSTMLGNRQLAASCLNTGFKCLYVSPTHTQTNQFSRDRLADPISLSPTLASWTTTKLSDNIHLKQFINHSQIRLRYAYHNADRTRGISSDLVCIDEIQDVLLANIPVIEETASHSPWRFFIYSGTPKSMDNPIEHYWVYYSTQNEWVIPCEHHGTPKDPGTWHWNILGEPNIGAHGVICDKCGKPLNLQHPLSQWAAMNPAPDIPEPFEGFRVPQLMVPWMRWTDVLQKQKFYPRARFFNEVLGLSYDSGVRPITRTQLRGICDDQLSMHPDDLRRLRTRLGGSGRVFMGVDWQGGSDTSYTVVALGTYLPGDTRFTVFYIHRFEGRESEPDVQLDLIKRLIRTWNIEHIACDFGGGLHPNAELIKTFGPVRVTKWQYSQPREMWRWEPGLHRYLVNRTAAMACFFNAMKEQRRQLIRYPAWKEFKEPYGSDFTNIFAEYNESTRQDDYKIAPETTDDSFHSALLCLLASTRHIPRPDIFIPMQDAA